VISYNSHFPFTLRDLNLETNQPAPSNVCAVLESSDCVVLRQSALSLLSEVMLLLRAEPLPFSSSSSSASSHTVLSLSEVLDIAHGVLRMDTSSAQSAVACRRSVYIYLLNKFFVIVDSNQDCDIVFSQVRGIPARLPHNGYG